MLKRIIFWLDIHGEETIVLLMLSYMAVSLNIGVFRRYVLNNTSPFTEEIARFLLIWIVFLGIPYAVRQNRHIVIDLLPERLSAGTTLVIDVISKVIFIIFSGLFMVLSIIAINYMAKSHIVTDAMEIPKSYVMLCFPIGFGLGILRLIQSIGYSIKQYHATLPEQKEQRKGEAAN